MNKRKMITVRILLLVAKWFAPSEWQHEIEQLATHIRVHGEEPTQ